MDNVRWVDVSITGLGDRQRQTKDILDAAVLVPGEAAARAAAENARQALKLLDLSKGDGRTPYLLLVKSVSAKNPSCTYVVSGFEATNCVWERWVFEAGEGRLFDCIRPADEQDGTNEIVYVLDGKQHRRLPDWVAIADKEVPPIISAGIQD